MIVNIDVKACSGCKKEFSTFMFGKNKTRKDGFNNECRVCARARYEEKSKSRKKLESHGLYNSGIYQCWADMKARCLNEKNTNFLNYGGRGITVSKDWFYFTKFYKDMGSRPNGLTLERIDNEKGYSKENCMWADRTAQNRNKRGCKDYCIPKGGQP